MKKKTYKSEILHILTCRADKLTCSEICVRLEAIFKKESKYLNGGISSILRKLVVDEILEYDSTTGPRGGYVYKLKR